MKIWKFWITFSKFYIDFQWTASPSRTKGSQRVSSEQPKQQRRDTICDVSPTGRIQGFETDDANMGPFCNLTCHFKLYMALFILGGMFQATTTVSYTTHDGREAAYDLWWPWCLAPPLLASGQDIVCTYRVYNIIHDAYPMHYASKYRKYCMISHDRWSFHSHKNRPHYVAQSLSMFMTWLRGMSQILFFRYWQRKSSNSVVLHCL